MHHIFIIDPFDSLIPNHDSSLALMKAVVSKGHKAWQAEISDVMWKVTHVQIQAKSVLMEENLLISGKEKKEFSLTSPQTIVWMRKDPPVEERYIRACQLLRLAHSPIINQPDFLMSCDEKFFALEFPEWIPETIVTQDRLFIKKLLTDKGHLVVKSAGGKGGEGILVLEAGDRNTSAVLDLLTDYGQKKIIAQEYLPKARIGDKRIFLLAGEPLGAILRIPAENDHRANMGAGASIAKTTLTEKEKSICRAVKPRLLELGLYIVGLDIIDEKLTEINITSPTCLEEIAQLDQSKPADTIIEWSESYDFSG